LLLSEPHPVIVVAMTAVITAALSVSRAKCFVDFVIISPNKKIKVKFKFFIWGQGLRPRNAPYAKTNYAKTHILKPNTQNRYGKINIKINIEINTY